MKIRGSVVSFSFILPHPPGDEKKQQLKTTGLCITQVAKMSIDPNIVELTPDAFRTILYKIARDSI